MTFKMVAVFGGTFTMGATAEQGNDVKDIEKPAHKVTVSDFMIGETEVTQELWQAVMGSNPSKFSSKNGYSTNLKRPVESVSWDDCHFYQEIELADWRDIPLAYGGYQYSGSDILQDVAWYCNNIDYVPHPGDATHTVATKLPNELPIYDMTGNVEERCQDWLGNYSSGAQTDPTGPSTGSYGPYRVVRGGNWAEFFNLCRVSRRSAMQPSMANGGLGLRLA